MQIGVFSCYYVPMKYLEPKTDEEMQFLYWYNVKMPFGMGDCAMNRICRYIEKEFENIEKDTYDDYKEVNIYKKEAEATDKKERAKKEASDFISSLWFNINNIQINFLKFISLSRYAQNKQAKEIFYKKYEFFLAYIQFL